VSIAAISLSFVEYNSGSLGYHSKLAYRRSAWPLDLKYTNKQFVSNYHSNLFSASWIDMHMQSQLVFCVIVIGGSIAEVAAYANGQYDGFLKKYVPKMDNFIAGTASMHT
jgi:hypothetical protein